jgi:hypothetical protein
MGRQHTSAIERILHRIEDRIEEWREQDRAHKAEAAAQREKLWASAAEREKLLAEAVAEEVRPEPADEVARRHRVVFVMHSDDVSPVLEAFATERACGRRSRAGEATKSRA